MTESRLRTRLQLSDEHLYHRFRAIEAELEKLLEFSQGGSHLFFTPHGLSHVSRLEQSYDWLLTQEDLDAFNRMEAFILLIATYVHDILMIPRRPGDETRARAEHASGVAEFLSGNSQVL